MAEITHFVKTDFTHRVNTDTSAVEESNYTITYENLTGAGFAAGDDVIIIVGVVHGTGHANVNMHFQVGFGTTYAGRTDDASSYQGMEGVTTTASTGQQYLWFDRRTLVDGEDIYFSRWSGNGSFEARSDGFFCIVLGLDDLTANDFGYADNTPSGDAPTSYDTSGASFSTPAAGDWLIFTCGHWLIDSTSADAFMAISAGGTDYSEYQMEGEDSADEWCFGTMAYRASLGSGQTVQARYRTDSASHDCDRTAVFGLRLDAFEDHDGAHNTSTITHSVLNTYQEFAGFGSYVKSSTGNLIAIGLPIHTINTLAVQFPYGQIQLAGSDWPSSNDQEERNGANGAEDQRGNVVFGYASVSSGTHDWDFDIAESNSVSPTFNCDEQIAAVFSLELGGAGPAVQQFLLRPPRLDGVGHGGIFPGNILHKLKYSV